MEASKLVMIGIVTLMLFVAIMDFFIRLSQQSTLMAGLFFIDIFMLFIITLEVERGEDGKKT